MDIEIIEMIIFSFSSIFLIIAIAFFIFEDYEVNDDR